MEKLLSKIEKSEVDNPLLTAALNEITRLRAKLIDIERIVDTISITRNEDGEEILLTQIEQNEIILDMVFLKFMEGI